MSEHVFDKQKWQATTIFEQMGNIGSEVGRALSAKRRGDEAGMQAAFCRGLDLLDASAEYLLKKKSPKLKEVLRARDQFSQSIVGDEADPTLEKYFMEYAIAARLNR